MGASSSKTPAATPTAAAPTESYMPSIDATRFATVPQEIVQLQQAQAAKAQQAAESARLAAEGLASEAAAKAGYYWSIIKGILYFLLIGGVIVGGLYLTDFIGQRFFDTQPIGILSATVNDATKRSVIQSGATTPPSKDKFTNYTENLENKEINTGLQWWMFVKDWNYGYGKEKVVLQVKEGSNTNPTVSLHPTDNSLKITMSIYPNSDAEAVPNEPLPARSTTASTNDVYVCEVRDIPLQTWFPVTLTVFGRNLDVYVDGKLVKSCVLPGVPKPIAGNIELSPTGGFSGFTCDIKKIDKKLTPTDASNHASAGLPCKFDKTQVVTDDSATTKSNGYSVKFGMYDSTGNKTTEYTF